MSLPARAARYLKSRALHWGTFAAYQPLHFWPWLTARRNRQAYVELREEELRRSRRSDTAFVFGSGYSLHDITAEEWARIAEHCTIGFNYWSRQRWVRTDYHLIGEIASRTDHRAADWVPAVREYAALIADNPFYKDTVLGLQMGWRALQSNRLVGMGLIRPGTRVFRYRRVGRDEARAPGRSLREGLVLGAGSLVPCVNFAVILGVRRIVLTGVDLYDARYFWLPPSEVREDMARARGSRLGEPHHAAARITEYLGRWADLLRREDVELCVYNPRSLLAQVMPVYASPARAEAARG
jgi:hypothetical protein